MQKSNQKDNAATVPFEADWQSSTNLILRRLSKRQQRYRHCVLLYLRTWIPRSCRWPNNTLLMSKLKQEKVSIYLQQANFLVGTDQGYYDTRECFFALHKRGLKIALWLGGFLQWRQTPSPRDWVVCRKGMLLRYVCLYFVTCKSRGCYQRNVQITDLQESSELPAESQPEFASENRCFS